MSSSAAATAALAAGTWQASKDPKTGKAYYVHKKTKRTVWNLDDELRAKGDSSSGADGAAAATGGGDAVAEALRSGEWAEKKDAKSGKAYYVHRTSKKTVWDLGKELAETRSKAAAATPAAAATGSHAAAGSTADAIAEVLRQGEWVEKLDPKSGKAYFFNKTTRKTTWDLAKELGLQQQRLTPEPVSPTPGTPAVAASSAEGSAAMTDDATDGTGKKSAKQASAAPKKSYDARAAIASGEWATTKDLGGTQYYVNRRTGESTADLELFLQIQQALDAAAAIDGIDAPQTSTAPDGGGSGAEPAMNDWVSLILRAPGHQHAADRLITPYVEQRLADADRAVQAARAGEDAANRKAAQLEHTVVQLREALAAQQHEVHQLQCAVFYGLNPAAAASTGAGTAAAAASTSASRLQQRPASSALRAQDLPYVPSVMDALGVINDANPSSAAARMAQLESLLAAAQGHNRQLQQELDALRRTGHEAATCRHCADNDPWTRILRSAAPLDSGTVHGPPRVAAQRDAAASLVPRQLLDPSSSRKRDAAEGSPVSAAATRRIQGPPSPAPRVEFPSWRHGQYVGSGPQVDLHAYPRALTSSYMR
jgi:Arc/MetJ family transcription regulator